MPRRLTVIHTCIKEFPLSIQSGNGRGEFSQSQKSNKASGKSIQMSFTFISKWTRSKWLSRLCYNSDEMEPWDDTGIVWIEDLAN